MVIKVATGLKLPYKYMHGHLYYMDGGLAISENNEGADQSILR